MMSGSDVSVLLLSGGESRRMGGHAKALLDVGGEPALARMARLSQVAGLRPMVVVVPPDDAAVEQLARALSAVIVRTDRSRLGRTASIQAGLEALPTTLDVLLWPVDHCFVQARTVRNLMEARLRDPLGRWFIPTWRGRGGHPVLIGHELFPRVLRMPVDRPLRDLLPEIGPQVVHVPVDDPAVASPVDTWPDYRRAHEGSGASGGTTWTGD